MNYLSVCSGIEAATVALHPLGWRPWAFSEIDAFPAAVLAHHYPEVPNLGDMTKYKEWPDAAIDVLVGGTPCQSFSVAGLRKGLADARGNLMLTYGAVAAKYRPRWLVWENVPGVLSSNFGRDFGTFLGMLAELGYGFAYRVLDAQYFGVPQRRRRVFVVGCLGDWCRAAAVLFDAASMRGDPAPSREAGKVSPTIPSRRSGCGGLGTDFDCDGGLIGVAAVTGTLATGGRGKAFPGTCAQDAAQGLTMRAMGHGASHANAGGQVAVCAIQAGACRENPETGPDGVGVSDSGVAYTLEARAEVQAVQASTHVRRLTPRECERLQGFPDDYTLIPVRGKPAADGPRYKALGNSMAVPVMAHIGRRIQMVECRWFRCAGGKTDVVELPCSAIQPHQQGA